MHSCLIARRTIRTEKIEKSPRRLRSVPDDEPTETRRDSASGRLNTRSGRGEPRPRVDSLEALLRPAPQPGRTRAPALDVTPAASVGTGNSAQWMVDAIQPRMQAWCEEFLTTELPQVAHVCLDRTVPALVDEHVRSAIPPLLDELLLAQVQHEVVTVLTTVDEESPSGTALKGSISSAVANRLATTFPPRQESKRARRGTEPLRILRQRTLNRSAPHPGSV